MKIEWQEDGFDVNEDMPEVKEKSKTDTLDKYNDEMARDAVSSLFDEDAEDPVVVGFDKPASKTAGRGVMRTVKPEGERPVERAKGDAPTEEMPPCKRDRTRETNPTPKPAVRYAPPPSKERRSHSTAVRGVSDDYGAEEVGVEEEMEAFRKRYKNADTPRRADGPKPRVERQTPTRSGRLHYDDIGGIDDEPVSPLRWIFIAASFVLLIITAFLTYRVTTLNEQLRVAQAAVDNLPDATLASQNQMEREAWEEQLQAKDNEIAELKAQIESGQALGGNNAPQFGLDNTPEGVSSPVPSSEEPTAEPPSAEQTYTAVAGDSISKIAQKFYGSQSEDNVNKIMAANNLTSTRVDIGQVFVIPPQ